MRCSADVSAEQPTRATAPDTLPAAGDENPARLSPDGSENSTNTSELNQGVVIAESPGFATLIRTRWRSNGAKTALKCQWVSRGLAATCLGTRTPKRAWPNSRSSSAVIRGASRRCCGSGPFRRSDELAKRAKKVPFFPTLSRRTGAHRARAKVMAHWLLWQRITASAANGADFWSGSREEKGKRKKAKGKSIVAAVVAALFRIAGIVPALCECRRSRAVGSRCDVSQFQNETALPCQAVAALCEFARILMRCARARAYPWLCEF